MSRNENEIHAVEMVREIRDALVASKTPEEVIECYRKAGNRALEEARARRHGSDRRENPVEES